MIAKVQNQPACDIKLETTVTKIGYSLDADQDLDKAKVHLETSTGECLHFDEVIITSPLGWLQQNLTVFSPHLPPALTKAINEIGYGCLEKVFLTFPAAFWDNPSNPSHTSHAFTHFLAPAYAPETNPNRHNIESISLSKLPGNCAHPTMIFYIYDALARQLSQELKSKPSAEEKEHHLIKYFTPYTSKLPCYLPDSPDFQPISAYFTDWLSDPLAGHGSYSNFMIPSDKHENDGGSSGSGGGDGDQALDTSIEMIREGMPKSGVWFSGEHTAPFVALGTVTGAWWSGEAVADRIAAKYGVGGF